MYRCHEQQECGHTQDSKDKELFSFFSSLIANTAMRETTARDQSYSTLNLTAEVTKKKLTSETKPKNTLTAAGSELK